jgi:hypothetical protein
VTKTDKLLDVSRATVCEVMLTHESCENNISEKEQRAKVNIDRVYRRTLRIVSKNHTTRAAQVRAELNM